MEDFFKLSDYYYYIKLDKMSNIMLCNAHLESQCPFIEKPMKGKSFSEMLYFKDFSTYEYFLEKSLREGDRNFTLELRIVNAEGSDFEWTKWEFTIAFDSNANPVVAGIGHVMKEKNHRFVKFPKELSEIHARHDLMEGLLDDNLIGFWIWDLANGTEKHSLSLNEMLGYHRHGEDARPIKWKRHIHSSDRAAVEKHLKDHFESRGKVPFHCEFRIKNRHKQEVWVLCYGKVLQWDEESKPKTMVGCFFDISEKKQTEKVLKQQQRLIHSVTFNQSHLIRAKLANILGILEIINTKSSGMETGHFLKMIKKEAKKLDEELKKSISQSSNLAVDSIRIEPN